MKLKLEAQILSLWWRQILSLGGDGTQSWACCGLSLVLGEQSKLRHYNLSVALLQA